MLLFYALRHVVSNKAFFNVFVSRLQQFAGHGAVYVHSCGVKQIG